MEVGVDSALLNCHKFLKQWVNKLSYLQNDSWFQSIAKEIFAAFSQNSDMHLNPKVGEFTVSTL